MALTTGTVHSVQTLRADSIAPFTLSSVLTGQQYAEVFFTMSGTYDQSANSSLVGVPTLIQNSRRNGKTVTMNGVMGGQPASKASAPDSMMATKTVAISSADVTFELTDGDFSTELAAAAIPAQSRPFSIVVAFTEA